MGKDAIYTKKFALDFVEDGDEALLKQKPAEDLIRLMGATSIEALEGGAIYLQIQMIGFLAMGITATITAALDPVSEAQLHEKTNTQAAASATGFWFSRAVY